MDPVYCSEGLSTKVLLLKEKQLGWALGVGGGLKNSKINGIRFEKRRNYVKRSTNANLCQCDSALFFGWSCNDPRRVGPEMAHVKRGRTWGLNTYSR